jgi:flagellar biosynthesis chaperone FliJ
MRKGSDEGVMVPEVESLKGQLKSLEIEHSRLKEELVTIRAHDSMNQALVTTYRELISTMEENEKLLKKEVNHYRFQVEVSKR